MTTATAKPETARAKIRAKATTAGESQTVKIELEKLHDHPGNPAPTTEEVTEMLIWLETQGQDEAITVRPLPDPIGHFEILAGRRRFAAARQLKWDTLEAKVRLDLDNDVLAAAFAARNNLERRTESDLRKAHWIRFQVQSLGLTITDAAKALGMAQGTASNLLSIASLCDSFPVWKKELDAGRLTAAHLRPLAKYRDYPEIIELLEKSYTRSVKAADEFWHLECWGTRSAVENSVEEVIRNDTRPLRKSDQIDRGDYRLPQFNADKLSEADTKTLRVLDLPRPGEKAGGELMQRCLAVKAWDALNIKATNETGKKPATKEATKPRTAAEQKKIDAQRLKQLGNRIRYWRHTWLRRLVAEAITEASAKNDTIIVERLLLWMATHPLTTWSLQTRLDEILLAEAFPAASKRRDRLGAWSPIENATTEQIFEGSLKLFCVLLFQDDKNKEYPLLDFDLVDSLARMAGVDVAKAWADLQRPTKHDDFEAFFQLHDKGQLEKLAKQLGVNLHAKTKAAAVGLLTGQPRALPLPKAIATLTKGKKAAK